MTEYRNKVFNPDAPWLIVDDTEENIMRDLERYTLDPVFERYGDFVNRSVQRNKASQEYQEARARMIAKLPVLTLANACIGKDYAFAGGWVTLTKVIHLTEEEANQDSLLYLDHWRGVDWQGRTVGAAFTDGRNLSSTSDWITNNI